MYNRFIIFLLLFNGITAFISCSSTKYSSSKKLLGVWQRQSVSIDGSNKDWPSPYPEYDDKAQIGYAVSNDRDNLYITMETGDPATQLKIIQQGFTLWIDRKGEKNELTAINFPIPSVQNNSTEKLARTFQGGLNQQKQRLDLEDLVKNSITGAKEYSLQGFKSCNLQFPLSENDSCGIKVRMALDEDNELIWEAVVPFKAFYFKPALSRPDKGKALSICFETTAMKRPAGHTSSGNRGNVGGVRPSFGVGGIGGLGMSGMTIGSGRGGNRNQQANDPMESAYKSSKTWKKFGLAFEENKQ